MHSQLIISLNIYYYKSLINSCTGLLVTGTCNNNKHKDCWLSKTKNKNS